MAALTTLNSLLLLLRTRINRMLRTITGFDGRLSIKYQWREWQVEHILAAEIKSALGLWIFHSRCM